MDWRLPFAVLAVLALFAGSAVVTSQVQEDLNAELETRGLFDDAEFRAPDASRARLDLDDFELPEDLDVKIPEGTRVDADLGELTLDKPLTLDLPPGFPLEDLPFTLPEDFRLDLPEGSTIDASGLTLPRGAKLTMPDGSTLVIPPGARLDLPADVMARLFAGGLEPGTLRDRAIVHVTDVPDGARGELDLPALDEGGALTLPPGTVLKVPEDAPFPFVPGVLSKGIPWTLPAGTALDWPALLAGAKGFTEFPAVTGVGGADPRARVVCEACRPVRTEITSAYPERLRKTEPFPVEGFVVDAATGDGLAGVPVDVFLNASKTEPGWPVGIGATAADGRFHVDARVPDDLPAGDYQLVARSRAFTLDGERWDEGWSDPPIAFYAATTLTLDVPEVDGVGARVPVRGALLDETGAPVARTVVDVYADGARAARAVTDAAGTFEAGVTFREAGAHNVSVRFTGTPALEPSAASASLRIVDYAIDVPGTVTVQRGGTVTLTGRVLTGGGGFDGARVTVGTPFGTLDAVTREGGHFSARLEVPRSASPVEATVTYRLEGQGLVKAQTLLVMVPGTFELDVPERVAEGEHVAFTYRFIPADGGPVEGGVPATVTVRGPDGVDVRHVRVPVGVGGGARDAFHAVSAGESTITLSTTSRVVQADAESATVRAGRVSVDWGLPGFSVRGEPVTLAGRVLIDGEPVRERAFTVLYTGAYSGTLDAGGGFSVREEVPRGTAPGPRDVRFMLGKLTMPPERVPASAIIATEQLPVKIRPRLEITAPESYSPDGDPLTAEVRLVDDGGTRLPLDGVTFTARADATGDALAATRYAIQPTDADGADAGFTITPPADGGHVRVHASFDGDETFTPASARATVRDGTIGLAGFAARVITPFTGFTLLGLAAVTGGAWWWRHRRRDAEPAAFAMEDDAPAPANEVPLSWPDLDDDLPRVFGVGEVVRVVADERVAWALGDEDAGERTEAELRLPLAPATVTVTARAPDGRRTVTRVRAVRYETEIAREFDALLDALGPVAPALTRQASPREVEAQLLAVAPPRAADAVDALVSVMEYANYADAVVTRAHYVRFHRAAAELASVLGPRENGLEAPA